MAPIKKKNPILKPKIGIFNPLQSLSTSQPGMCVAKLRIRNVMIDLWLIPVTVRSKE